MSTTPDPPAPSRARSLRVPRQVRHDNPEARMSLMEHIRELRSRLLKALLGLAVGLAVGWFVFTPAWHFIAEPFCKIHIGGPVGCDPQTGHPLIVTGVFGAFFLHLKIAFVVGLLASSRSGCISYGHSSRPGSTRGSGAGRMPSSARQCRCSRSAGHSPIWR